MPPPPQVFAAPSGIAAIRAGMRRYWTTVRAFQAKHPRMSVLDARRSPTFKRDYARLVGPATDKAEAMARIRALRRLGLHTKKGKTWRDYLRKRGRK